MLDGKLMAKRQRMLADFGEFALCSDDLDDVLTEACRLVGGALNTDLAKVIEIQEKTLFVRAGVGWPAGVVGKVRLPMGERSSETYAVKKGEPIITDDIANEDRFEFPDFLKRAGVVGIVNVPIRLPGGEAYGLLQVDSRKAWCPTEDEVEFLRTYATILGPVIDRLHKVHALRNALDRNTTLLLELQHRVKNNIAVLGALVQLRIRRLKSTEPHEEVALSELAVIAGRVEALRLAHEKVYEAKVGDRLPLGQYATELLRSTLALHQELEVELQADVDHVEAMTDLAVPIGLILNEFTTNSLKYAFPEHFSDRRQITLEIKRDEHLSVTISDNGIGLPGEKAEPRPGRGTGMGLIEGLAKQIGASWHWSDVDGTSLRLDIPARRLPGPRGRIV